MSPGATPTLSFCRPIEPYVGIGYHRSLHEIDRSACRRLGLPVIRRRIGGGPVYLDADQLFFQITLPADRAPARVDRLYELCLEPAAEAFRSLGLGARRNGANDISVEDRKISGTGAGRIGDGVTVVGNVMLRFPHERMVEILALPGDRLRRESLRLMRRHVSSLADAGLEGIGFEQAREALISAYSRTFGEPTEDSLSTAEETAIRQWQDRFQDPKWLAGPELPATETHRIKISADAWLLAATTEGLSVEVTIANGRIERAWIESDTSDKSDKSESDKSDRSDIALLGRRLTGLPARSAALRAELEPYGERGSRILSLLEPLPPAA